MADAHEVYKELSGEINSLSNDVVAAISVFRATNSEARDDLRRVDARVESLNEKVSELRAQLAAASGRLEDAAKKAELDNRVKTEDVKGRWAFWVAVGGGVLGTITAIVNGIVALMS